MKAKHIISRKSEEFEEMVNEFISNENIIVYEVKYSTSVIDNGASVWTLFSSLITYEELNQIIKNNI